MLEHDGLEADEPAGEPRMDDINRLRATIRRRIVGNDDIIEHILVCLLAGGHMLLESPPGLGKTEMSKAVADSMDMCFKRIQCTPDLTPQDIIGAAHADAEAGMRFFARGPVFTNLLLVDEINRAQPKTQSAFLEAMAERCVTYGGQTYRLPEPFMVIATQNPVEYEGTYSLPEAQQDRFLMKACMGYLKSDDERQVIRSAMSSENAMKVYSPQDVVTIQRHVMENVGADDGVIDYIIAVVAATRARKEVMVGASTRAAVLFAKAVKARAYLSGRECASADDVAALAHPLLRHRLVMNPDARNFGYTSDNLIDDVLRKVKPPKPNRT